MPALKLELICSVSCQYATEMSSIMLSLVFFVVHEIVYMFHTYSVNYVHCTGNCYSKLCQVFHKVVNCGGIFSDSFITTLSIVKEF